jgi:hypothetical protein
MMMWFIGGGGWWDCLGGGVRGLAVGAEIQRG